MLLKTVYDLMINMLLPVTEPGCKLSDLPHIFSGPHNSRVKYSEESDDWNSSWI